MKKFTILAVSTAALALAACSDQQDETPITQEAADDMDVAVMDDDAMMAENSSAPSNSDAMGSNSDSMTGASSANTTSTSGGSTSDDSMADSSDSSNVAALPARSQMDFAYLDRNSDGQLSVAEYAIWAVPANPNTPVENDQTKPYISTDQINEAGKTFFYFDEDGNTYLSDGEFTAARNSARTPGGSSM